MTPPQQAAAFIAAGAALGLTRQELLAVLQEDAQTPTSEIPTVGEYTPKVAAASRAGSVRTYGTYWTKFEATFGARRLDEFTTTDLRQFIEEVRMQSRRRRNSVDGAGAAENAIGALRRLFTCAVDDGYLTTNPAQELDKPARHPSIRRRNHRPGTRHPDPIQRFRAGFAADAVSSGVRSPTRRCPCPDRHRS